MNFWLIQAIGLAGSLIVILAVQFNNRKLLLIAQGVGCALWIVHYGYLGAMTAVYTNVISFARSVVFYNNEKKWAKSTLWLWLFIGLFIINSALTWDGFRSILPGIAMSLTSVALWTKNSRLTRTLFVIESPFWLSYDIITKSYSCALIEAIAFASYILAVVRFDILMPRRKKKEDNNNAEDRN